MGHVLFVVLHLAALVFFAAALFVTLPAHAIYAAVRPRVSAESPPAWLLTRCPVCREQVRRDAARCKHCGAALQPEDVAQLQRQEARHELRTGVVLVLVLGGAVLLWWLVLA